MSLNQANRLPATRLSSSKGLESQGCGGKGGGFGRDATLLENISGGVSHLSMRWAQQATFAEHFISTSRHPFQTYGLYIAGHERGL